MLKINSIQQNDLETLANNGFWEQFHHDFQIHESDIYKLNRWTQTEMFVLHLQLIFSSEYQHALIRAKNKVIKNNNLVIPLFERDFLRVNLIAIKPECNLPLHDHPGSSGSMIVISGNIRATVCELTKPVENTRQSTCKLSVIDNKILSTGETSCFTQERHNIHSFEAVTDRAVIMVIHTPPFAVNQQSFFFTASPQQKIGSQVLAQRVRVQAVQNLRQHNAKISGSLQNETYF